MSPDTNSDMRILSSEVMVQMGILKLTLCKERTTANRQRLAFLDEWVPQNYGLADQDMMGIPDNNMQKNFDTPLKTATPARYLVTSAREPIV